jgi:hypothetical protein
MLSDCYEILIIAKLAVVFLSAPSYVLLITLMSAYGRYSAVAAVYLLCRYIEAISRY